MVNFWDSAVWPLLDVFSPRRIVEVGAASGNQTRKLVSWAVAHDATVHVVDPEPAFDVDAYAQASTGHFVLHRELSLRALPVIGPVDLVLLDGDHNWYTVVNELRTIEQIHADWPLVMAHDVGWPYGRRDMYYDPTTIPLAFRHVHRKAGLRRLHSVLVDDGKNAAFFHAEHEGGFRNGVLTAIEDFIEGSRLDLVFLAQPGPAGLGIIVSAAGLKQNPKLRSVLAKIHDPDYATTIAPVYATRELDSVSPPVRTRAGVNAAVAEPGVDCQTSLERARAKIALLLAERQALRVELDRALASRAWRIGHGLTSTARRLTLRHTFGTSALANARNRVADAAPELPSTPSQADC